MPDGRLMARCGLCDEVRFPVVACSAGPVCAACVALVIEFTLADVRARGLMRDAAGDAPVAALLG